MTFRDLIKAAADRVEILQNEAEDLNELVRRLVWRLPPASPKGEEARDVLVWLTLLRAAALGRVAFISGDKGAFYADGKLRRELLDDLGTHQDHVESFSRIDEFLRIHHARSSFIDLPWVEAQLDSEQVKMAIATYLDHHAEVLDENIASNVFPPTV